MANVLLQSVAKLVRTTAESADACRACGHTAPHWEEDDSGVARLCSFVRQHGRSCEKHQRWSRRCFETGGGCDQDPEVCLCSAEYKLIADLLYRMTQ
jgi:hypothetical protein